MWVGLPRGYHRRRRRSAVSQAPGCPGARVQGPPSCCRQRAKVLTAKRRGVVIGAHTPRSAFVASVRSRTSWPHPERGVDEVVELVLPESAADCGPPIRQRHGGRARGAVRADGHPNVHRNGAIGSPGSPVDQRLQRRDQMRIVGLSTFTAATEPGDRQEHPTAHAPVRWRCRAESRPTAGCAVNSLRERIDCAAHVQREVRVGTAAG